MIVSSFIHHHYLYCHLAFLAALGCCISSIVQADIIGLQTGPAIADTYAAQIMTDSGANTFYLVGNTYDPNLASDAAIELPANIPFSESACFALSWNSSEGRSDWEKTSIIGNGNGLNSCRAVGMIQPPLSLLLLGNSEPGGLVFESTNTDLVMSGFVAVLEHDTLFPTGGTTIQMSRDDKIPYPISVVTEDADSGGSGSVYVIALSSTDDEPSQFYDGIINSGVEYPNWIQFEKYGTSWDMTVMKFDFSQPVNSMGFASGPPVLTSAWHVEFPVQPNEQGIIPRVYLGGMILKNGEYLIIAGSTRGFGNGYGYAFGDDEDGFISLLDIETGQLAQGRKNQERIGSANDDLITGICDNPNDPNSFFVVGATKGNVGGIQEEQLDIQPDSLQAFIKKIDSRTLFAVWTVQWGAARDDLITTAYALSCTMTETDNLVYVAGQVEDGAGMVQGYTVQESNGGDDIWVAQLKDNGNDYDLKWMRQIGTDGEDHLARYGSIVKDTSDNAVIFGDTTGSLLRNRESTEQFADAFVMILEKDFGQSQSSSEAPSEATLAFSGAPSETPSKSFSGAPSETPSESFSGAPPAEVISEAPSESPSTNMTDVPSVDAPSTDPPSASNSEDSGYDNNTSTFIATVVTGLISIALFLTARY